MVITVLQIKSAKFSSVCKLCDVIFLEAHLGVILPSDLDPTIVVQFEELMKQYTQYKKEVVQPSLTQQENQQLSSKIAGFLIKSKFTIFLRNECRMLFKILLLGGKNFSLYHYNLFSMYFVHFVGILYQAQACHYV